jgi:hypothetical protein
MGEERHAPERSKLEKVVCIASLNGFVYLRRTASASTTALKDWVVFREERKWNKVKRVAGAS